MLRSALAFLQGRCSLEACGAHWRSRNISDSQDLRDFLADCQIDHDILSMYSALEAARIMGNHVDGLDVIAPNA
jgi:hypothetical protein